MASTETNKREKLVDELLGRKEFVELWVMKFAELLKIRSDNQESYKAACSITTGSRTSSPTTCRWTRSCRTCSTRPAGRSRARDQLLRARARSAEAGRGHRPGLHGYAHSMRQSTIIRSTAGR